MVRVMQFGNVEIPHSEQPLMIIKDKNIEYKISKAERVILLCLFESQNDVVSYDHLMKLGWGGYFR
jgi:DNA-binding winged helix-turn-helix (wHTH) protein